MSLFAIIKTGGKQYKVAQGDVLSVEKISDESRKKDSVIFNDVLLLVGDKDIQVGKPRVLGATVEARVVEDGKAKKKMVFRYTSKTRYRKKKGHRQPFTKVEITKILSKSSTNSTPKVIPQSKTISSPKIVKKPTPSSK